MKTDDLITMLAKGPAPTAQPGTKRFALALGWGMFGATLLMALLLGVRADLAGALAMPMFWAKLSFPAVAALAALQLARRLARPGLRPGTAPLVLAALLLSSWAGAATTLLAAAPDARAALIFGDTWRTCPFNIALLSLPVFIAMFWAIKGLAPTRPALAGGSAGLTAGAAGAAVYALHCPEMAAPFLGIWYVLGIALPALAGALLGPMALRW
ncbi:MAG: NrsF family protein [Burkholderiaceae bacterium]